MNSRLKFTFFAILLSLCIIPLSSHAQIPTSIDGIDIYSYPAAPSPGQTMSVEVQSFSTNLSGASILWKIDGKTFANGVGKTTIEFPAPALGKTLTITAVIKTVEGSERTKIISVKSGAVDLVWESAGFVPPFYKGKAGYAYENQIRFIALPHIGGANGVEVDPRTLIYKWTVNDQVVQAQSGYGRQILTLQEELPKTLNVEVDVSTSNGTGRAIANFSLTPGDPSISFYEEDPLYGVLYNKALTNTVNLSSPEVSVHAVPFLFNTSGEDDLAYNWSVNNLERSDLGKNESITLRAREGTSGTSLISLQIRNLARILQGAENSFNVYFNKAAEENRILFQ